MSEFESFLANFDDAFKKTEAAGFDTLPDGKYQGRVASIHIEPNKKTGELALRMEFEVAVGEYTGRRLFYYKSINSNQLPYLKSDLMRLHIEPEPFSKIESYFPVVLDKIVDLQLKTGKPDKEGKTYQNLYINKVVGDAPAVSARQMATVTDDLPF